MPESDRPPVLLWAGLDRDLSPEIEAAICEVFPGDPERVHLATVRVMEVVLSRVPPSGLEGCAWCLHFDRAIDYRLVKEDRPPCIEERHGCAGCPESTCRVHRVTDR